MAKVVLTLLFVPWAATFGQEIPSEQPSPDAGASGQEAHELDEYGGEREAQDPYDDLIFSKVSAPSHPILRHPAD